MDRLTELFANKPTSYLGPGIIYNGDTRGNGVSSSEQDVTVMPRGTPDVASVFRHPFKIVASGAITPGWVNSVLPTLDGEPLTTTENLIDMTDAVVYLEITFSVTWTESYLASASVSGVTVESGASVPSSSATVKRVQIATISDGIATMMVFNNITAVLIDDGVDATEIVTLTAP